MSCSSTSFLNGPGAVTFQLFEDVRTHHGLITFTYICGYIPLAGSFVAIYHVAHGVRLWNAGDSDRIKKYNCINAKALWVRAGLEFVGLGALMAPLDIGFTLARLVRACIDGVKRHKKSVENA